MHRYIDRYIDRREKLNDVMQLIKMMMIVW